MKKKIKYVKLPYQKQFHESVKPKAYLSAGYGGGKTYSLCMKGLKLMDINGALPGGLLAPNLKMFKRDVLPTFREVARKYRFKFEFNKQDSVLWFPTTKTEVYVFHAEDDGESIRGPNLAWGLINEVTLCSELSFKAFLARIRIKSAKLRQLAMSGTPEGFNWAYDYFVASPRADTDLIFGDMRLNKYIADDYAEMLLTSYDSAMVQQYVEGKHVNQTGLTAIHKFSRSKHTAEGIERIAGLPVWVSLDFNVAPMAAALWNRVPDRDSSGHRLRCFDEVKLENSDTPEMCRVLREKLGDDDPIVVFPDPAGRNRDTRSGKTDFKILEENGFKELRYRTKISLKDCWNAGNSFFQKNHAIINSQRCKELIKDFEQCVLKQGSNELDKSNPKRTHWLDGAKNMIEYEFPIVARAGGWREQQIR